MSYLTCDNMSDEKTEAYFKKILTSKSKPYLGRGDMKIGVSIDTTTGETEMVLPQNLAPDTLGYNTNIKNQIERKEMMKARLLKKLNLKKSISN